MHDRPLIVKINDLVFCHAGISKNHLDICDKYNKDIFHINKIWYNLLTNNTDRNDLEIINKIILIVKVYYGQEKCNLKIT